MSPMHLGALALAAATLAGCAPVAPLLGGSTPARHHPRADEVRPARAERAPSTPSTPSAPRPAPQQPERDEIALREGIALYDEGDYNGAIRRLNGSEMNGAALRHRLAALKYTAFSYCVSGRQALCRQSFDRALRLDPAFDLAAGEHGHPLWGPVFTQAKQAARR